MLIIIAANTIDTIDTNLIKILIDGPLVSLNGSPTVSPTTAALWQSEPFPPCFPDSMYFLALSQAPPAFAIITAKTNPVTVVPASIPVTPLTPKTKPTIIGAIIPIKAGTSISL